MKGKLYNQCIDYASHAVGLDYKNPYTRHGKKFYKPYRNYFGTVRNDKVWCELEKLGYAKCYDVKIINQEEHASFKLTRSGLDWLGKVLDVKIYDETM